MTLPEQIQAIRAALDLDGDCHARLNLLGALLDIEYRDGRADAACIETINRVISQLKAVEGIVDTGERT